MQEETEYQKEYKELMKKRFNIDIRNNNLTNKDERICAECQITFKLNSKNFRYADIKKNIFQYDCKKCARIKQKKSIQENPETLISYKKTPAYNYSQLRSQYKKKNITITFSLEYYKDNLINKECHYCKKQNEYSVLVEDNKAISCCKKCKKIRSLISHEELKKLR